MNDSNTQEAIHDWQQPAKTPFFITLYYYQANHLSADWQYPVMLTFDDGQDHFVSYASKVPVGRSLAEVVEEETRKLFNTDQLIIDLVIPADQAKTRDGQILPRFGVHVYIPPKLLARPFAAHLTPIWLAYSSKKLRNIDALGYLMQQTRQVQREFAERFQVELRTNTLESADQLEAGFAKMTMPTAEEGFWVQAFGSYLTVLMLFFWEGVLIRDDKEDNWTLSLLGKSGEMMRTSPFNKVAKRFHNGEEDHLGFYVRMCDRLAEPRQTDKIFVG